MIDFAGDPRGVQLQLLLERAKYERWLISEVQALLDREFSRVVDLILSPQFRSLTQFQQARRLELFRELDRRIKTFYSGVADTQVAELRRYASVEARVARLIVQGALPDVSIGAATLSPAFLRAVASLPIQGLSLGEWFDAQANTMSIETRRILQNGLVEGKGVAEITRRIVADRRTEGAVLSRRMKNEAKIITRTAVTAVHNAAALESYANLPPEVSDSYRYVAVLDSRTSAICRGLDGNVYRYSDPKKKLPPQHPNCRSTTVPLLKGGDATLTEQRDQPLSMRSYEAWLRAQSEAKQNEILGPTRAQWFRDRKLSLAELIDDDNRVLTLAQLRQRLGITDHVPSPALAGAL